MSVRANERKQGDLTVIIKAKELAAHTLKVTSNEKVFPRRYRFSIVNKMQDKAFSIVANLIEANEILPRTKSEYEHRRLLQRKAMAECRSLATLIDISKETFQISTDRCSYWARMIFEIRTMTAAWFKKDEERFMKLMN